MATALGLLPAAASAVSSHRSTGRAHATLRPGRAFLDVRPAAQSTALQRIPASRAAAAAALGRALGPQAVVALDPRTGTPHQVARLDGFLTSPSSSSATSVALGFVRAHPQVFGLTDPDLAALRAPRSFVGVDGATHIRWAQQYNGVPVFENELSANVDRRGRLINVLGSPLTDASVTSTRPGLTPLEALSRARSDARATGSFPALRGTSSGPERTTSFADGSQASLVIFHLPAGNVLAWHLYAYADPTHTYEYVIDAASGRVLFRENIVVASSGEGSAWFYNPSPIFGPSNGLADGHTQSLQNFPDDWGPVSHTALNGNNTHVYSDVNDNNVADSGEEVAPTAFDVEGHPIFNYPGTDFTNSNAFGDCSSNFPCSWDYFDNEGSWSTNRRQNAAQVFWFVNNFHDHLAASPIGFTAAAGNFQLNNNGQGGVAGDPVLAENDDGANTDGFGGPDGNHVDNANMSTRQDGVSPRMQMYLFTQNGFVDANGGDEADVVYHEYTHGLSHRLITDAQGFPRLDGEQAGAMGEGWSDWYAMDYLISQNLDTDSNDHAGDVNLGYYVSAAQHLIRSMAMNCMPGTSDTSTSGTDCTNSTTGHLDGYTLADYGQISGGGPEVHADGEIWGQTLWQIREALKASSGCPTVGTCSPKAEDLITRAMELSPPDPSMLDERDAILQADQADFAGADVNTLWSIFAQRGMGYFAADLGSNDTSPVADFHTPPPAASRTGTLTGKFTNSDTGAPVPAATVMFADHADLSAQSNGSGQYTISHLAPGTYPYLFAFATGYDSLLRTNVAIPSGSKTLNFNVRRDWASAAGGGNVTSSSAPDLSVFGCGPTGAIDQSQGSGWGSYATNFAGDPGNGLPSAPLGARQVTIKLPAAVDVTSFGVDPGATCGDDDTASLAQYRIELSPDGSTFHQVAAGTFTNTNDHKLNTVSLTGTGANSLYVRLTMQSNQGPDGNSSHVAYQRFMDMSELEVYAIPKPVVTAVSPRAGSTAGGNTLTLTGTAFVPGSTVQFGSTGTALPTTFVSHTKLTVTAPAHAAGTAPVLVTTPAGTSTATNAALYAFGAPAVTAVSPRAGSTAGGNTLTITGHGFVPGATVKFGSTGTALPTTLVSGTQLKVVAPAHAAGSVPVLVTSPAGTSTASNAALYAFGAPKVTAVSPRAGSTAGGNTLTVTGSGFVPGATVKFGSTGTSLPTTLVSATQLKVVAPAHAAGDVFVLVTTPAGTSTGTNAALYAFGAPAVTALSPNTGSTAGGNTVTITGSGFVQGATVKFGSTGTALPTTLVSSTHLTVVAPAHAAGAVPVQVTTPAGTSAATASSQYTFSASLAARRFASLRQDDALGFRTLAPFAVA